ncbi:MAG TPA: hypothetical protein PKA00_11830 [Saprospiraceae bacterium]|nr:hypothetical protein [Saprospiraceae bacterium]HMQ83594.1 hypothetical protein [Saprospiraceae bacterium]
MNSTFIDFDLIDISEAVDVQKMLPDNGLKSILVFLPISNQSEAHLIGFLEKVFAAVQIDLKRQVSLFFLTNETPLNLNSLHRLADIPHVLFFGISPEAVGLNMEYSYYQPILFQSCTYLFAHDLNTLYEERQQGGKQYSGALWKNLKQLFLKET